MDICLYRYENFEKTDAKIKDYLAFEERLWKGYNILDLKQSVIDLLKEDESRYLRGIGLNENGFDEEGIKVIHKDHDSYPENEFKIGYFPLLQEEESLDSVLRDLGLPNLLSIFDGEENLVFKPNWDSSLEKVERLIQDFSRIGKYMTRPIFINPVGSDRVQGKKDAMKIFLRHLEKPSSEIEERSGEFYLEGDKKLLGLIPGTYNFSPFRKNKESCMYAIVEFDNTELLHSLEIVRDTIKFVLEQEDKEKYYLYVNLY